MPDASTEHGDWRVRCATPPPLSGGCAPGVRMTLARPRRARQAVAVADLTQYRAKRNPERPPEPFGSGPAPGADDRFVIQEHHARRLHYDVRFERGGVLV